MVFFPYPARFVKIPAMSADNASPHYAGHRERIRKKFLKEGITPFSDYEALELLLTYSVPRRDVKPVAKQLLGKFGSLSSVMDAPPEDLKKTGGVSEHTAAFIHLIKEVNWRYMESRIDPADYLTSPEAVIRFCKARIGRETREYLAVVFVNTKNQFLAHEVLSGGSVGSVNLDIRNVVKKAIDVKKCSGIIVFHNHPSGHPGPSDSDKKITAELARICKSLEIRLVDHLIVCSHDHYSFVENGLLG
ncbi:MAG: DNA repair protein RadC [Candidatus Dadabacteria bacterium]|nr:DNA repair protein RadC [Candidatus Dadabacteria bacterium]